MRIALYGGSFDPPHLGHQMAALWVLETQPFDELWLLPAFEHPLGKPLVPFDQRLEMCRLAAAPLGPRVRVSDVERTLPGASRTLRTVKHLREIRPGDSFGLVVGSDLVDESRTWYGADELRALIPFVVVGRAGAEAEAPAGRLALPAISSTDARAAIAAGRRPSELVPRAVLDHIYARGLYGAPETR